MRLVKYNHASMKKTLFTFSLMLTTFLAIGQSKLTYGIQFNQSESTSPMVDICILNTTGGQCFDLEGTWALNVNLIANYQFNKRLRFQTGLGFNQLNFNGINNILGEKRFNYDFLSIPVKGHFMILNSRHKLYVGSGFRIDYRVGGIEETRFDDTVFDNSAKTGVMLESLVGFEYQLNSEWAFHFEPTYAIGITDYSRTSNSGIINNSRWPVIGERPERIGISLGLTFSPNN